MQWDEVVEELQGITIDKQGLVKDLIEFCLDVGSFVYQCNCRNQELICRECGIEGWTDTIIDTIGKVALILTVISCLDVCYSSCGLHRFHLRMRTVLTGTRLYIACC